ncbi:hypothetical protein ACT3CD_14385 [Geofilum sp. OHC36d9]|uniref:hypothetical protein n=1 Tax=Geofilum sp. OHC36d9 TaxID=3458413 RepID=UPI004033F929
MEKHQSLESFIHQNRSGFDSQTPSPELWSRIARQIPVEQTPQTKKQKNALFYIRRIAAIGLIALIIPSAWYFIRTDSKTTALSESVLSEIAETTDYYESQIKEKRQQVINLTANNPAITEEMDLDLAQLDQVLKELKTDLKDDVSNPEVISAMIQNYRLRLQIMEQLLDFIEKEKNDTTKQEAYEKYIL